MEMPDSSVKSSRHQICFATSQTLAYVSVLELGAVWERSLRRAGIPLKYSQGFNPRPRMAFAAPLPVGCGSEADLLDVWLEKPADAESLARALAGKTPRDLQVVEITPVAEGQPALAEQLCAAEYRVALNGADRSAVESALATFMAQESVSMPRRGHKNRNKPYDLRALVEDIAVLPDEGSGVVLWMRLTARAGATGRPDEVLKALGLKDEPRRCTRTRLILGEPRVS